MGGRWLPEIVENHYSFAQEIIYIDKAAMSNIRELEFVVGKKKVKIPKKVIKSTIKISDDQKEILQKILNDAKHIVIDFPTEYEKPIYKKFRVLLPVMEYACSSHSELNNIGYIPIVSKEIIQYLKLSNEPQTFNLFEENGRIASIVTNHFDKEKNHEKFVYMRKDLLDRFIAENDYKLIWCIWGEREPFLNDIGFHHDFHQKNNLNYKDLKFQDVIEYE